MLVCTVAELSKELSMMTRFRKWIVHRGFEVKLFLVFVLGWFVAEIFLWHFERNELLQELFYSTRVFRLLS